MTSAAGRDLNQIRALFLKSFFLQLKQYKTNICQLLFPVFCLLFIFILQAVLNTLVAGFLNAAGSDGVVKINSTSLELSQLMFQAKKSEQSQNLVLQSEPTATKNLTFSPPEAFYITSDKQNYLSSIPTGRLGPRTGTTNGFLRFVSPMSRLFGTVNGTYNETGNIMIPYSLDAPFTNETQMDEQIYDELGAVGRKEKLVAIGGYVIRDFSVYDGTRKNGINYTVEYDYNEKTQFCKQIIGKTPISYVAKSCRDVLGVGMQNWMNDAFLRNVTGSYRILTYTAQMPYDTEVATFQIADLLGFFFFPMILCLLLPSFSFTIVLEKQFKLREMMKLMGMKMRYYWVVTYIFQYILYCISAALFIIFCLIFKFRFITQTSPLILCKYNEILSRLILLKSSSSFCGDLHWLASPSSCHHLLARQLWQLLCHT